MFYCPCCERKTGHTLVNAPPPASKSISPWGALTFGLLKVRCDRCGRVSAKS
jgi:hypothetical protein